MDRGHVKCALGLGYLGNMYEFMIFSDSLNRMNYFRSNVAYLCAKRSGRFNANTEILSQHISLQVCREGSCYWKARGKVFSRESFRGCFLECRSGFVQLIAKTISSSFPPVKHPLDDFITSMYTVPRLEDHTHHLPFNFSPQPSLSSESTPPRYSLDPSMPAQRTWYGYLVRRSRLSHCGTGYSCMLASYQLNNKEQQVSERTVRELRNGFTFVARDFCFDEVTDFSSR